MQQPLAATILFVTVCDLAGLAWGQGTTGKSERRQPVLDALGMPYSQQIDNFWQTLNRCVKENPEFEITAKVSEHEVRPLWGAGRYHYFSYEYSIRLPDFMTAGLPCLVGSDEQPLLEMLLAQALRNKEVSYYAALLAIRAGFNHWSGHSSAPPMLDRDKTKWQEKHDRYMPYWFESDRPREKNERYLRWLFLRLLSEQHRRELKVTRDTLVGADDSMSEHRRRKAEIKEGRPPIGYDDEIAVGDAIFDYAEKADAGRLVKLPADRKTLLIWSAFLVNSDDKDLPAVVNAFLRYAEAQKHAPLYADMALALLVVRGYEYDPAKGRYTLTDVGQRFLEYAIEHPIPELLRVAEVLNGRWDKEALMKLIQKHHADVDNWDAFRRKLAGTR